MSSNVNFYANDPSATDVSLEQVQYKVEDLPQKWKIQGNSPAVGLYNPGTLEFQFYQLNQTLYRCVAMWNNIYQNAFKSWSSTENLVVIPELDYRTIADAEDGFNAYYDRPGGLNFFYDTDDITHKQVYTAESPDIVAHECGHAVLDAVQPDFWNAIYSEIGAFHEAYGDCSAILTTLLDDNVRKAFLRTRVNESNFISRLAEQMGHALFSRYGRDASSQESLRDAINEFTYQDPNTLPDRGPDTMLTREVHSFARVFVGAFYGSFARIYQVLAQELTDKEQALVKAHDSIGQILASAVLGSTVTPFLYRDVASGMLKADERLFAGKFRQAINDAFVDKKILTSPVQSLNMHSVSGSAKPLSGIEVPENINEIKSEKFAKRVSEYLGISDSKKLDIGVAKGLRSNSLIVKGSYDKFKTLKSEAPDLPDEVEAYVPSGFAILVDTTTKSITSHSHETDTDTISHAQSSLRHLVKAKKIYIPKGDEKVDKSKLVALHKPYYLSEGKRILRAYFA